MSSRELEATACHEAGHAVIALLLGRPIHKISIEPQQERLGHCQLQRGSTRPTKDAIEREVLILMGGVVAEARWHGRYEWSGAARDLREIAGLLAIGGGNERQLARSERRLLDKTESLLDRAGVWPAVVAIARMLLEKTTISGRAARHLFETEMARHADQ